MQLRLRRHLVLPLLVAVLGAAAAGIVASQSARLDRHVLGPYPAMTVLFLALAVAAELKPLKWLSRQDGGEVTASWAFYFALVPLAPQVSLLAPFTITLLAMLIDRAGLMRVVFNAAQIAVSLGTGLAVMQFIDHPTGIMDDGYASPRWVLALFTGASVALLLNTSLTCVALALHRGMPVWGVLRGALFVSFTMDLMLVALSPVLVIVAVNGMVMVPILVLTVGAVYRLSSVALDQRHDATHDQLTGLPNRRLFYDQAAVMLEATGRRPGAYAAVAHLDLDGFKGINDRLGHHVGDQVLREVADRLNRARRSTDIVARLGGDEFAIFFTEIANVRDAHERVAAQLALLSEPLDIEGVPVAVGGSFGLALYPDHGEDVESMLRHADVAMYRAKTAGGGIVMYDDTRDGRGTGRLSLLADLNDAMAHRELVLEYQPAVDVATGDIVGVEALIRWNHPRFGRLMPDAFMPAAEHTEFMEPLTAWVLTEAVGQCARWQALGIPLTVAINCSARNLHDLRFPATVASTIAAAGIDPASIEIEITENTVMADPARSAEVLAGLRSLGVSIAIDDFGTGYSSLASLRELPIDRIKIDRSFVTGMVDNADDLVIVRSIVELAHNLGLGTVAEGVETTEVWTALQSLGCDSAQGYLMSRPVHADRITAMLASGARSLVHGRVA